MQNQQKRNLGSANQIYILNQCASYNQNCQGQDKNSHDSTVLGILGIPLLLANGCQEWCKPQHAKSKVGNHGTPPCSGSRYNSGAGNQHLCFLETEVTVDNAYKACKKAQHNNCRTDFSYDINQFIESQHYR